MQRQAPIAQQAAQLAAALGSSAQPLSFISSTWCDGRFAEFRPSCHRNSAALTCRCRAPHSPRRDAVLSDGNSFADVYNIARARHVRAEPVSPVPGQDPDGWVRGASHRRDGSADKSYTDAQAQHDAWAAANPAPPAAAKTPGTTMNNTGWNQNPVGSPLNPAGDWTQLAPELPGANQQQQANYAYNLGLGGLPIRRRTRPTSARAAEPAKLGQMGPIRAKVGQVRRRIRSTCARPISTHWVESWPIKQSGAVMQPGAQPTGGQQPSVLDAFLAAHPGGGSSIPAAIRTPAFSTRLASCRRKSREPRHDRDRAPRSDVRQPDGPGPAGGRSCARSSPRAAGRWGSSACAGSWSPRAWRPPAASPGAPAPPPQPAGQSTAHRRYSIAAGSRAAVCAARAARPGAMRSITAWR